MATHELMNVVSSHRRLTVLFGARDEKHNQAIVLAFYIKRRLRARRTPLASKED
jgi:uncharacterized protein YeaO (DUF488 family)